ncbi:class I SAM-dependent methyltransferase [Paucibacter sp. B2R-40]|jgi:demethylmenaquinone methyltransferase/2-methoxy-6-polyprenyl-1,4-benzoquinol methylase|uniref:class I SAM-dependent methyltransferase n=1 Tax=Paucibacter sp. B2R-40 TaxID=2893554 RepID=UPI0021E46512|nr:class I SAM-dependent methyltransferase [Paucibacter sp. B2R-40]MCV2353143.1 class I SAM-dependent methyltransferase [Paucibacter sp. B2R-40]
MTNSEISAEVSRTEQMPRYYAQRAREYEQVFDRPHRQPNIAAIKRWLGEQFTDRQVLEVATGTGFWLPAATARALSWQCTDINAEVLEVAKAKPLDFTKLSFRLADAYALDLVPAGSPSPFDAAFAGLWFSHVPLQRRASWLAQLHAQLAPGAVVILMDNRFVAGDSTPISRVDAEGNGYQVRSLSDGSQHEVLKNFPTLEQLQVLLASQARDIEWQELDYFWTLKYRLH